MDDLKSLKALFERVKEKAIADYLQFLRFPSISSSLDHVKDVEACARWVESYLKAGGMKVEWWETAGNPVLFASYEAGKNLPTLLLYGHYDVQPVDPLELWKSPPFEPKIIDGVVYARGAQDNKGQCFYTLLALTTLLKERGSLPINVKYIIEGEEEVGSPSLPALLEEKKEELGADYLAIVDVGMHEKNRPAITYGARGLFTMDVVVKGSKTDLHSGSHGGIAFNPIHALVQILASLRDPKTGTVTIPHFYDAVVPLTQDERGEFCFSLDEESYKTHFGIAPTGGEKSFSPAERLMIRPTLEINGITGGYSGPGFKTVIPAEAAAKISCRLVPDQDPLAIGNLVKEAIMAAAPPGIQVQVRIHPGGGEPLRGKTRSTVAKAFAKAYQEIFGKPVDHLLDGASIPITTKLARASGSDTVFVGLGLPTDQIHAPNEHFSLERIEQGYLSIARVLGILAEVIK